MAKYIALERGQIPANVAPVKRPDMTGARRVMRMIEVGEETGALPEVLMRIADVYDEEVDNAVLALTALVEPLMIVVMAVMVGTIVIALFLPIVRIVQGLG